MLKYILVLIVFLCLGFIFKRIKKRKKYKKVQPLSKQNFKKAMKDLEIK